MRGRRCDRSLRAQLAIQSLVIAGLLLSPGCRSSSAPRAADEPPQDKNIIFPVEGAIVPPAPPGWRLNGLLSWTQPPHDGSPGAFAELISEPPATWHRHPGDGSDAMTDDPASSGNLGGLAAARRWLPAERTMEKDRFDLTLAIRRDEWIDYFKVSNARARDVAVMEHFAAGIRFIRPEQPQWLPLIRASTRVGYRPPPDGEWVSAHNSDDPPIRRASLPSGGSVEIRVYSSGVGSIAETNRILKGRTADHRAPRWKHVRWSPGVQRSEAYQPDLTYGGQPGGYVVGSRVQTAKGTLAMDFLADATSKLELERFAQSVLETVSTIEQAGDAATPWRVYAAPLPEKSVP